MSSEWEKRWLLFNPEFGRGGRGKVQRVFNRASEKRPGVLKVLQDPYRENQLERRKFLKEIEIQARLQHPGLPPLLDRTQGDYSNSDAELFYVRQFVDGMPLNHLLPALHYEVDESIVFVLRLLEVVSFLHRSVPAVIHRDIKPQNIIVLNKFDPILIDFGAAYSDDGLGNSKFTNRPGVVGNAFLKMSGKEDTTPRLDVMQCCGILSYLLTHEFPGNVFNLPLPHRRHPWVSEVDDASKELLSKVLDHGLALNEGLRYPTTDEACADLRTALEQLDRRSIKTRLALSSLQSNARGELTSDLVRYERLQQTLLKTFADLAELMALSPAPETYEKLLEKGLTFVSAHDGNPIIEADQRKDILTFLELSDKAPGDRTSFECAIQALPAIIDYTNTRMIQHREAATLATLAMVRSERDSSIEEFQKLLEQLGTNIGLKDVPPKEVEAYQDYLDTINNGFDGEFATVKEMWYGRFWKFGAAIHFTDKITSSHLLYKIPKGVSCPLLMQLDQVQYADWMSRYQELNKNPLGKWSKFFAVAPVRDSVSTSFMNAPKRHGEEFLYEHFEKAIAGQRFPLYGELLCIEQIFEFVDFYGLPLNQPASDEIELQDVLNRIYDDFVRWFVPAVKRYSTAGFAVLNDDTLKTFLCWGVSDSQSHDRVVDEGDKQIVNALLTCWGPWMTTISCKNLLSNGITKIKRPYQMYGQTPICLVDSVDQAKLLSNVTLVLTNTLNELESMIKGNGLTRLLSAEEIAPDIAIIYRTEVDKWAGSKGDSTVQRIVRREQTPAEKVRIEHGPPITGPDLRRAFVEQNVLSAPISFAGGHKMFSSHPLREQVYEILSRLGKEVYAPSSSYARPI